MVMTETINFALGAALFVRSIFKAVLVYADVSKSPAGERVRGVGLDRHFPTSLPSIVDIKQVIPKGCFQSSLAWSMAYAIKDLVQVIGLYALISYLDAITTSPVLRAAFFALYWFAQGTVFMGVFCIGHDCGHSSFSTYPVINDIIGTISHAFLMVPYYPWKLSHRHHHKNTGNFDRDEVFYPMRESANKQEADAGVSSAASPGSPILPGFGLGFGWLVYLVKGYNPRPVCHFNPFDSMFVGHVVGCIASLAAMGGYGYALFAYYETYGWEAVALYYLMPLFVGASYIVVITFLHHSEVNVPWYADETWDFVKGQLSSVDRHYGLVHSTIHNIGTHQIHHLFAKIPHYHLEEATLHFRRAFPQLVRRCDEPILLSFVRMFKKFVAQCIIKRGALEHSYQ